MANGYCLDIWTASEIYSKNKKYKGFQMYLELCYILIVLSGNGTVL